MSSDANSTKASNPTRPWYLIWVLAAVALAAFNLVEVYTTGEVSSIIIAAAWLCWAFSWYAKPFRLDFRANFIQAFAAQPLRAGVSQSLWNGATIAAFLLLVVGMGLKLTNAA